MGYVRVKGLIGRSEKEAVEVEFLADMGVFYTVISPGLAEKLGIKAVGEAELTLADKRKVKAGITIAYMKFLDREGMLPIAIMEVPEPLLGTTALEGLGLKIDPSTGRLEHSRPYGLSIM